MNKWFELAKQYTEKNRRILKACKHCDDRNPMIVSDWNCFDPPVFKYIVVFVKENFIWKTKHILVCKYKWPNGIKFPFDIIGAGWSTIHVCLKEFDLDMASEIARGVLCQKISEFEDI